MWSTLAVAIPLIGCLASTTATTTTAAYLDPAIDGGSMMTVMEQTWPPGLAEPLNLIVLGTSSPRVLVPQQTNGGLFGYLEALGYGPECGGFHMGDKQAANLGDNQGNQEQMAILRWMYFGDPFFGTCIESIYGGSHVRVFRQSISGAFFISASTEENAAQNHQLGMNATILILTRLSRDYVAGNATGQRIVASEMNNTSTWSGTKSKRGWNYTTTVSYVKGLINTNRLLWNHYAAVQMIDQDITDGWTALLQVEVEKI
ncbi:hypothetical protein BCR39DRAFT_463098 [Naematelia encephala]|uniref:Uncharacterized protein n=1 Tax=Naematelia encephala TaxID=71784 RepID=A0A1Y2BIU9_9TREE|nr:hypothetical protein BCR39DRAFT_463098 [Naematelia encephala]